MKTYNFVHTIGVVSESKEDAKKQFEKFLSGASLVFFNCPINWDLKDDDIEDDSVSIEEFKEDLTDRVTQIINFVADHRDLDTFSDLAVIQNDLQELLSVIDNEIVKEK